MSFMWYVFQQSDDCDIIHIYVEDDVAEIWSWIFFHLDTPPHICYLLTITPRHLV